MTEGSNLPAIWRIASDLVDIDKLDTNDIWAVLQTYGVEAARAAVIREVLVISCARFRLIANWHGVIARESSVFMVLRLTTGI